MFQTIISACSRWSTSDDAGTAEPETGHSDGGADLGSERPIRADDDGKPDAPTTALDEDAVYGLLGNDRRRACLKLLSRSGTEWEVNDLSERVAERVADASTSPDDIYDSVYISLCQNHLPHLDEFDVVEYDPDEKTVRIGPAYDNLHRYWFVDQKSEESEPSLSRLALASSVLTVPTLSTVWLALPSLSTVVLPALIVLHVSVLAVELGPDYRS